MPIENELKYLLALDFDTGRLAGWQRHDIRQAYLDDGPRIRQIDNDYVFTYKKWIAATGELVEIETALSRDDFDLLWSERVQFLAKTRFKRVIGDGEWVVDVLRDDAGTVFAVLAEVEMPRYAAAPENIPEAIAPYVLHAAEPGDSRFTNKRLSDPAHAERMYNEFMQKA